jgi:FkbM family methyltransferase
MVEPGRNRIDAQVAVATARARAQPPEPSAPESQPRKGPRRFLLRLLKRVLQPLLSRLRRYFVEPLRQEMLVWHNEDRAHAGEQFLKLQRQIDDACGAIRAAQQSERDEMRIIYTGLVDHIHAAASAYSREFADARAGVDAALVHLEATQKRLVEILEDPGQRHAFALGQLEGHPAGQAHVLQDTIAQLQGQFSAQMQALQNASMQLTRVENYAFASARRVAVPCGDGEMLVKTEAGYILCSDSDLSVLSTLVDTGDLERGTRLLIESLLRPGDVFVDVGANIGMHTLAAGRAMAGQGTMIAFEPFGPTCRLLEKSVWINGFGPITRIHGCAVSDREDAVPLYLGASSGHHSLIALNHAAASDQVQVRTVRLDDVIEPQLNVSLLKIDAEGAELEVLAGAAATIHGNPDIAVIAEFGPSHLHRSGQLATAWLAAFEAFGFEYRAIDPSSGALVRRSLDELQALDSTNLFFARPGSAAWTKVKERV